MKMWWMINVSNLILFLPIAVALAVVLAMTGNPVVRPKRDVMRTFVQVLISQLIALSLFGLFARLTWIAILCALFTLCMAVTVAMWERGLARSTILLALLANHGDRRRLDAVSQYLAAEGLGYWKRLGRRFQRSLTQTGNWVVAARHSRIARDEHDRVSLAILEHTGDEAASRRQLMRAIEQRQLGSQWRGRLVAGALSFVPLLFLGLMYSDNPLGIMRLRLDMIARDMTNMATPPVDTWQSLAKLNLHIFLPILIWALIGLAYLVKAIPWLSRHRPIRWLYMNQHRALCLDTLSVVVQSQPQLSQACRSVGEAMPVRSWAERLNQVAQRVDAGEEFVPALEKNGLLRHPESTALSLCRDPQSLAWALHEVSESLWQRIRTRTGLWVQLLVLVMIFISAWLTTVIAVSVFSHLIGWIEAANAMPR